MALSKILRDIVSGKQHDEDEENEGEIEENNEENNEKNNEFIKILEGVELNQEKIDEYLRAYANKIDELMKKFEMFEKLASLFGSEKKEFDDGFQGEKEDSNILIENIQQEKYIEFFKIIGINRSNLQRILELFNIEENDFIRSFNELDIERNNLASVSVDDLRKVWGLFLSEEDLLKIFDNSFVDINSKDDLLQLLQKGFKFFITLTKFMQVFPQLFSGSKSDKNEVEDCDDESFYSCENNYANSPSNDLDNPCFDLEVERGDVSYDGRDVYDERRVEDYVGDEYKNRYKSKKSKKTPSFDPKKAQFFDRYHKHRGRFYDRAPSFMYNNKHRANALFGAGRSRTSFNDFYHRFRDAKNEKNQKTKEIILNLQSKIRSLSISKENFETYLVKIDEFLNFIDKKYIGFDYVDPWNKPKSLSFGEGWPGRARFQFRYFLENAIIIPHMHFLELMGSFLRCIISDNKEWMYMGYFKKILATMVHLKKLHAEGIKFLDNHIKCLSRAVKQENPEEIDLERLEKEFKEKEDDLVSKKDELRQDDEYYDKYHDKSYDEYNEAFWLEKDSSNPYGAYLRRYNAFAMDPEHHQNFYFPCVSARNKANRLMFGSKKNGGGFFYFYADIFNSFSEKRDEIIRLEAKIQTFREDSKKLRLEGSEEEKEKFGKYLEEIEKEYPIIGINLSQNNSITLTQGEPTDVNERFILNFSDGVTKIDDNNFRIYLENQEWSKNSEKNIRTTEINEKDFRFYLQKQDVFLLEKAHYLQQLALFTRYIVCNNGEHIYYDFLGRITEEMKSLELECHNEIKLLDFHLKDLNDKVDRYSDEMSFSKKSKMQFRYDGYCSNNDDNDPKKDDDGNEKKKKKKRRRDRSSNYDY